MASNHTIRKQIKMKYKCNPMCKMQQLKLWHLQDILWNVILLPVLISCLFSIAEHLSY